MNTYAYIRVSTKEQNINRQLAALADFQIPDDHIFCDHQSGKDFARPAYQALLQVLKPHDLLIVKSIASDKNHCAYAKKIISEGRQFGILHITKEY